MKYGSLTKQSETGGIKMKKKVLIISLIILIGVIVFYICRGMKKIDLNGTISYHQYNDKTPGIYFLDLNTKEQRFVPGYRFVKYLTPNEALFMNFYTNIKKINLLTDDIEAVYDTGEEVYYYTKVNDSEISFDDTRRSIYILNLNNNEKRLVVDDSSASYHGWRDGKLIYSNTNREIIEFNPETNNKRKLLDGGLAPIVSPSGDAIAFKDLDFKLNVYNFETNKQYTFGLADYYCFSPESDMLLIEDGMTLFTALKNLFLQKIVLGHRILVWDYRNNRTTTILDACKSGAGLGFSWK